MLYDITPPITEHLGVWPGDTRVSREVLFDIARGDSVTLSTLRATVHLGAHADGPNHYDARGGGIGERSLEFYVGGCQVIDCRASRGGRVGVADLALGSGGIAQKRVLLRTGTFPDPNTWNEDFAGIAPELIDWLADRGAITVGIDTPSVDVQNSKDLPTHHAIARRGMAILEGLALRGVPAGEYELIALPLRLMGFDASPVRAVLRVLGQ